MANGERTEPAVLPLAAAAARLGLSSDALRMRIRRGKAGGFKEGGRVYVYLDAAGPAAGTAEQRANRPAGRGAAAGGPWSVVVESQKQEMARLIGELERLNQRLDRQFDEARELRQMLQREQVLRQQEQSLRQELQDMLERLVAPPALARPEAETAPGEGSRIIMRATAPRETETGAAPASAPEAAREAADPAPEPPAPAPEPQPAQDRPAETQAAAPPPDIPPEAEDLANMLKEIGQSLRDIEDHRAARAPDLEDERRAAAQVMSRLFRSRAMPRPPES